MYTTPLTVSGPKHITKESLSKNTERLGNPGSSREKIPQRSSYVLKGLLKRRSAARRKSKWEKACELSRVLKQE